jgi:HPt (histidine-containing phosphotransfer) domain-containing protein
MGIEEAQILARFDGDVDLAGEVSEMFINECPKHLNDLCTAIRDGNAKALEGSAHAVKGSIGNFSTKGAHESALKLEQLARFNQLLLRMTKDIVPS